VGLTKLNKHPIRKNCPDILLILCASFAPLRLCGLKWRGLLFLLLLLLFRNAAAQQEDLNELARAKYVQRFPEYFFVWPVVKQRRTSFVLQSLKDNRQKLTYRPNVSYYAGAGTYIFGIGFQLVAAIPQNNSNIERFGESRAVDLQANILGKNWGFDLFTQDYKGYYVDDPNRPLPAGAPNPQRQDVRTRNTGVTGAYFFDKRRFSIKSTYNYFERQRKSAGSFLLSGNFNTFSLRADSSIYSAFYEALLGQNANFKSVSYTTVAVAPGYAYNFVVRSWFLGISLALGPGINWINYQTTSGPSKAAVQLNTFTDLRLSFGYNGVRVFSGITFSQQSRNINYEGVRFTSSNDVIKFAVGYRFRAVGILRKTVADFLRPKTSS
jgi:hypothetical protein